MFCEICGKTLVEPQHRFCSNSCHCKSQYHNNPHRRAATLGSGIRKCRRCKQPYDWTYGAGIYCHRGCELNLKACLWCGAIFIAQVPRGRSYSYCDDECHFLAKAEQDREEERLARKTKPARLAKWKARHARYLKTPKGKATSRRCVKRYLSTPKGKEWIERHKNTWRGKAAYLIHIEKKPCKVCGEADVEMLQCDHIRPRAMNGSDDWDNLQVLCIKCHTEKSAIDIKRITAYWKKVADNIALTVVAGDADNVAQVQHDVYQETVESLEGISNA